MKKVRLALLVLVAALVLAQLIPVKRTNPPVESLVQAPPAVLAALRKSCWDCHSNETVWGWHTRIAPISWLVASDVDEGREKMNFSRWNAVDPKRREKLAKKIPEEVGDGDMPPLLYALAHPSARPTEAEKAEIIAWGRTLAAPPAAGSPAPQPGAGDARREAGEHEKPEHDR
ncbi:MAG TPA: heme-binding domain-containing protein [Anaeromyxobacter sp.]